MSHRTIIRIRRRYGALPSPRSTAQQPPQCPSLLDALYTGPGTSLTIGLPDRHVWVSGQSTSGNGTFTANLPTGEVFTMPHKDRVDGIVVGDQGTQL